MIYLDNLASSRADEKVLRAMYECYLNNYANPSSTHAAGTLARTVLNDARETISSLMGCSFDEIYFNSGASEGLTTLITGLINSRTKLIGQKGKVITTAIEHSAVLEILKKFEGDGIIEIHYVPINRLGQISLLELKAKIEKNTLFTCIQHVNNEIGTIQPIEEIGSICKTMEIPFLADTTQSIGKIPINLEHCNISCCVASAHKFHGPKGIGFMYINNSVRELLEPFIYGGGQEFGLRSGTQNLPGIVGLQTALQISLDEMNDSIKTIGEMKRMIIDYLTHEGLNIKINSPIDTTLYNTISLTFSKRSGREFISEQPNILVSLGAACASNVGKKSTTLLSCGLNEDDIDRTIRIGLSKFNTIDEIYTLCDIIKTFDNE